MKLILFVLLPLLAHAEPPPAHLCYGEHCVGKMAEIAQAFDNAQGIEAKLFPILASGECYSLGPYYNSERTDYGVVLLDSREGKFYMGGRFSYFMEPNPYADWTLEKARGEFKPTMFNLTHELELNDTYAYANMNRGTEGDPVFYWLRRSGDYLLLEGFMGSSLSLFCQLHRHHE
ncbi:MAG: hypothetical protein ACXWQO_02140 [Bdellovibrionota bacterium]